MNNQHGDLELRLNTTGSTDLMVLNSEPTCIPRRTDIALFYLIIVQLFSSLVAVSLFLTCIRKRLRRIWSWKLPSRWRAAPNYATHPRASEIISKQEKTALDSLIKVLTPPHSVWPEWYTALSSRLPHDPSTSASCLQKKSLTLPLSRVLGDLCQNQIQLRDPNDNMHRFILGEIRCHDWQFLIKVDIMIYLRVVKWMALSYLFSGIEKLRLQQGEYMRPSLSLRMNRNIVEELPSKQMHLLSFDERFTAPDRLDLDYVAYTHLQKVLEDAYDNLPRGIPLIIEFTAIASNISLWDAAFWASAVAFMPRGQLNGSSNSLASDEKEYSVTPLLNSLPNVLTLLRPFTTVSVRNTSEYSAKRLRRACTQISNYQPRAKRDLGTSWRAERVMTSWMAGLHECGLVVRWEVTVQK